MNDELLRDLILAIDQQLVSPVTPYVKKHFDRLVKLGLTEDEAKAQIAICLGEEMDNVVKTKKPFDENAYKLSLLQLPFPEDDEHDEDDGGEENNLQPNESTGV